MGAIVDTLQESGIVTLEGVFSPREMAILRELGDRTTEAASAVDTYKGRSREQLLCRGPNGTIFWLADFYEICEEALRFARHPAILDVLRALLDDEPISFASAGYFIDKIPTNDVDVKWHQDSYFVLVPPAGVTPDPQNYWGRLGRFHVLPNQIEWSEDFHGSNVVVRINVDAQTPQNGCLRVLPGSHRCGPFELTGGLEEYVKEHEAVAVDCGGCEGSVTFHYPTIVHSSRSNTDPGTHRRAVVNRFRRSTMRIPGWDWPPDLTAPSMSVFAEDGFDLNPFASALQASC